MPIRRQKEYLKPGKLGEIVVIKAPGEKPPKGTALPGVPDNR